MKGWAKQNCPVTLSLNTKVCANFLPKLLLFINSKWNLISKWNKKELLCVCVCVCVHVCVCVLQLDHTIHKHYHTNNTVTYVPIFCAYAHLIMKQKRQRASASVCVCLFPLDQAAFPNTTTLATQQQHKSQYFLCIHRLTTFSKTG